MHVTYVISAKKPVPAENFPVRAIANVLSNQDDADLNVL